MKTLKTLTKLGGASIVAVLIGISGVSIANATGKDVSSCQKDTKQRCIQKPKEPVSVNPNQETEMSINNSQENNQKVDQEQNVKVNQNQTQNQSQSIQPVMLKEKVIEKREAKTAPAPASAPTVSDNLPETGPLNSGAGAVMGLTTLGTTFGIWLRSRKRLNNSLGS